MPPCRTCRACGCCNINCHDDLGQSDLRTSAPHLAMPSSLLPFHASWHGTYRRPSPTETQSLPRMRKLTLPLPLLAGTGLAAPVDLVAPVTALTRLPAAGGHWDLCAATKLLQFLDEPGACQTKRQLPANHNLFFDSSFLHQPQGSRLRLAVRLMLSHTDTHTQSHTDTQTH